MRRLSEKARRPLKRREQAAEQQHAEPQTERKPRGQLDVSVRSLAVRKDELVAVVQNGEEEGVEPGEHDQSEFQLECRVGPVHEWVGDEELNSTREIDQEPDDH